MFDENIVIIRHNNWFRRNYMYWSEHGRWGAYE
jgi:hypothetical protein